MSTTIGDRSVNLFRVLPDETSYISAAHTVSHVDSVALRRTLADKKGAQPLRTNMRFERGFVAPSATDPAAEKSVTVSIAVTLPPGVTASAAKSYVVDTLTQAATQMGELAITGDIHL